MFTIADIPIELFESYLKQEFQLASNTQVYRGIYETDVQYSLNEIVLYEDTYYYCTTETKGEWNVANWNAINSYVAQSYPLGTYILYNDALYKSTIITNTTWLQAEWLNITLTPDDGSWETYYRTFKNLVNRNFYKGRLLGTDADFDERKQDTIILMKERYLNGLNIADFMQYITNQSVLRNSIKSLTDWIGNIQQTDYTVNYETEGDRLWILVCKGDTSGSTQASLDQAYSDFSYDSPTTPFHAIYNAKGNLDLTPYTRQLDEHMMEKTVEGDTPVGYLPTFSEAKPDLIDYDRDRVIHAILTKYYTDLDSTVTLTIDYSLVDSLQDIFEDNVETSIYEGIVKINNIDDFLTEYNPFEYIFIKEVRDHG